MLISDEEAGHAVGTTAQEAADFLNQHSAQRQVLHDASTSLRPQCLTTLYPT